MQNNLTVTVHSVLSNVAKIHSRLPAAMEFWLVCLGSNPGQADNIIRFAACCKYYSNSSIWQPKVSIDKTIQKNTFQNIIGLTASFVSLRIVFVHCT